MTTGPYVRDRAGRFARLPDTLLRDVPPIPTPRPVDIEPEDRYYRVPAPKCPHGSFARWATRNCCADRRTR